MVALSPSLDILDAGASGLSFRCEGDALASALAIVGRAIPKQASANSSLQGIRAELEGNTLSLMATDLDLTIRQTLPVAGLGDGVVILPGKIFTDVVKSMPAGAVEITANGEEVQIEGNRTNFVLRCIPVDEVWGRVAEPVEGEQLVVPAAQIVTALCQVVPAAATEDSRQVLLGVLFIAEEEQVSIVATDSYRLAVRSLGELSLVKSGQKLLIPARALSEVSRVMADAASVRVTFGERKASFEINGVEITTQLMQGEFPPFRRLLPNNCSIFVTTDRAELMEAISRVKLLAPTDNMAVKMDLSEGQAVLKVQGRVEGQGSQTVDVTLEGTDELSIGFNGDYLLAGLHALQGEKVRISIVDSSKPCLLHSTTDADFTYLCMPVRFNK